MTNLTAASLAFDAAGLALCLVLLCMVYRRTGVSRVFVRLLVGAVVHVGSLCLSMFLRIRGIDDSPEAVAYIILIIAAGALTAGLALWCLLSDGDGKMTCLSEWEPIKITAIAGALLPVSIALLCWSLWHISAVGFAISLSLVVVYAAAEAQFQRELAEKEQALNIRQAKVLREQMLPHFVYNSLMSIQYLIYTDPEAAAECLNSFTGYLRGNIDAVTNDELIPFTKELEHINQYIALERAGIDRKFEVDFDFEIEDFSIPALTVQPMVENAVKHGALSRRDGTGRVRVTTRRIGRFISVTVTDNGVEVSMTDKQRDHQSIGIENARARLESQCGGSLTVKRTDSGTESVIILPDRRSRK